MTKTPILALILAAAFVAGPAMAKDGGQRAERMFERLDVDGDGRISKAEADERRAAGFARMDANGDGAVTREEQEAAREERRENRAERAERRFSNLDADGDDRITRSEFDAQGDERFAAADANGDGFLSMDEIRDRRMAKRGER